MRPVRLTLQAFGPFPGREVVDFRSAVDSGLFGIYGKTGSGKSTIFSAMTFALFGEAAKKEQDAQSLRSDHADSDVPTEVEFVFDIADRRYVALRAPEQMRPKARGEGETRSVHEAYLFDATGMAPDEITVADRGRTIAEKKVRDVDAAIADMLGYGAEQFRQIVLLPQGRFERFLAAKTKERLEILRELFDVSAYEALMVDLRSEADTAVEKVRAERDLCARQLAAEGFESTDALTAGIEAERLALAELQTIEEKTRAKSQAAEMAFRRAETLEEKFKAAEETQAKLEELETQRKEIEDLDGRVRKAERARTLVESEARVTEGEGEVRDAGEVRNAARSAAEEAARNAETAAAILKREEGRASDVEALRQRKDVLERFAGVLKAAAENESAVETAMADENAALRDLETAKAEIADLIEKRDADGAALKTARETAGLRRTITDRRADMVARHRIASDYETAMRDVLTAEREVAEKQVASKDAARNADEARRRFDAAEQNLASAQALHLSVKLEAGSPCPVCGATEHPAPATGDVGNAGLDRAFRESQASWKEADRLARSAAETLAGLRATLDDRKRRLSDLQQPEEDASALKEKIAIEDEALQALGSDVDIEAAEAALDELARRIVALESRRDELRNRYETCRNETTKARSVREGKLSEVPEDHRDAAALANAQARVGEALRAMIEARSAAEDAARTAREVALGAAKELEAAEKTLVECQGRRQKAVEIFAARLAESGLSAEEYQSLKPGIETLESDREAVQSYWRGHQSAADARATAAAAIEGMERPDLATLRDKHEAVSEALATATEARVKAGARVDHLARLRAGLEEAMRKIDAAEAASGPLRQLAALANGQNTQRLTLETFVIGAMFDQVLDATNLRYGPMSGHQYRLEREEEGGGRGKRGLGTQVFDVHTGKPRGTDTLSGGETFIAALALALGLADVVEGASGKVRLDTIFIDEGFGSLDTENGSGTLDQVLEVLNGIVRQNRAVGLISHVPLVQEAIPNGYYIRKGLAGSTVEERGSI